MTKRHLAPPAAQPPERNGWRLVAMVVYVMIVGFAAFLLV